MFKIKINGIVQGVGFRPFIFRLASEMEIKGYVLNSTSGVEIEALSSETILYKFLERIKQETPPASVINSFEFKIIPDKKYYDFTIKKSGKDETSLTFIPPDIALCDDCLKELYEKKNFRYDYHSYHSQYHKIQLHHKNFNIRFSRYF
jgi:hydrogenase maturation protein HypF